MSLRTLLTVIVTVAALIGCDLDKPLLPSPVAVSTAP